MKISNIADRLSKIISIIMVTVSLALLCIIKSRNIMAGYNMFYSPVQGIPNEPSVILQAGAGPDAPSTAPESVLKPSSLHAASACLIEASTGRVLYDKDAYSPLPMASTTKIMTCITALENSSPDDIVAVSSYAAGMPDVQLNICKGEQYRLGDLLYSLMLESHNDTAVAIAEHIGGTVEGFAKLMNDKAALIGCNDTKFVTPNGLDADGHHTTARDLCMIAAYAVKNDSFLNIISTPSHSFSDLSGKRNFTVNNKDLFLTSYDGALGIKTGFTGKAGYCFVGAAERNGMTLISSVLASGWPPDKNYKWADTKALMDYGFSYYSLCPIPVNTIALNPVPVRNAGGRCESFTKEIPVSTEGSITYPLSPGDSVSVNINLPDYIEPPVNAGDVTGSLSVLLNGETLYSQNIISGASATAYESKDIIKFVMDMFLI